MDDARDLRALILERIHLWVTNGSEFPSELADEIMEIFEAERQEDYRSAVIDMTTR